MFTSVEAQQAVHELPFVEVDNADIHFWNVESTGHSATDIELGESYALAARAVARTFGPLVIAMILRDIVNAGRFTGIEAGFIATIASAARVGSHH